MALLPLQLCPPPPQDVVGWVKGWLAASWNGPFVLSPMLCQSQGPALYQKKNATFPAERAITRALVTCTLPLQKDILPGKLSFTSK